MPYHQVQYRDITTRLIPIHFHIVVVQTTNSLPLHIYTQHPLDPNPLLGPALPMVALARRDNPLVRLAHPSRLEAALGRRAPGADGVDVALRLASTTTVGMVAWEVVSLAERAAGRGRGNSHAFMATPLTVGLMLSQRLRPALPSCSCW